MEMRDEHWDESLWHNSLKLHLTGRNAASISRDAIWAALLAVGVNPKDIVDLWHGEISHQINLSLKYEGGVMACLTANTIDLPNGVKGNFLHANRTLADIKVHRVPACFSDRAFSELFEQVCTVREVRTLYDENGTHTGVRTLPCGDGAENPPADLTPDPHQGRALLPRHREGDAAQVPGVWGPRPHLLQLSPVSGQTATLPPRTAAAEAATPSTQDDVPWPHPGDQTIHHHQGPRDQPQSTPPCRQQTGPGSPMRRD